MKKSYFFKFFVFAVIAAFVTVTSCKNYDDDISDLEGKIAKLSTTLNDLKTKVDAGAVITNVASVPGGVDVTLSNNTVIHLTNGKDGANGADGTNGVNGAQGPQGETGPQGPQGENGADGEGTVIIADESGYWSINGVLTDYSWKGEKGDAGLDGKDGKDGKDGVDGVDGIYYIPDATTKTWHKVEKGLNTDTGISWQTTGTGVITAIVNEEQGIVTFYNVQAGNGITNISFPYNMAGAIDILVTDITLDYQGNDAPNRDRRLNFSTAPAQKTWTFAEGFEGAISFVKGERLIDATQEFEIKVTPASVDLKKLVEAGKVYLIRRDGNNEVNEYIKAVDAKRSTALRAAPSVTGLWDVTFKMPADANVADLRPLVADQTTTVPYLFAVAIENTVDQAENAAERYVISDFGVEIEASEKEPVYNFRDFDADPELANDLNFSVKRGEESTYTSYKTIRNRYQFSETGASVPLDQMWNNTDGTGAGVWTEDEVTTNDTNDERTDPLSFSFFTVEPGKTFNVKLDNPDAVYAYSIEKDMEWALESDVSEKNAWNGYDITGLNKVYKADEIANLQISPSANGDIIGFRVKVVNYDGTLVDPDGKSFYVYVGNIATSSIAFTQTITDYVAPGATVPSDVIGFTPNNIANTDHAEFNMTIGNGVTLNIGNIVQFEANGTSSTAIWAITKNLQITGVKPSDLEEGKTYTGTLTLYNSLNIPFNITTVTLKKVLPTFTADPEISYKSEILNDVNGQQVIYAYPLPEAVTSPALPTYGDYNLVNALNEIDVTNAFGAGFLVKNNPLSPTYPIPTWSTANTSGTIPTAEIGVPYNNGSTIAVPGHGRIYDVKLAKDFGAVLYDGSTEYMVYWNPALASTPQPPIKIEFRSFIQDLKEWQYDATEGAPKLKYGETLTYSLGNIKAMPPVGRLINMTETTGALQDSRKFEVIEVTLFTGNNFSVPNEYFIADVSSGTDIVFTLKSGSTAPSGPVATKLRITLEDDFGHQYSFIVPQVFYMEKN